MSIYFEYILLPHNDDITKPRALNTFLDGLAELGIDKGLIKNKRLLSDLIEKEKGYQNVKNTSDNESNNEESSSDIENQEEEEELASENGVEAEVTQEGDNDTENDSQETESSSPETSTTFHSKSPCENCENSNVYSTLIMKCPKCFWHDNYSICPICDHQIPRREITSKRAFFGVTIVEQLHTKTPRRWKPIFIPLLKKRTKKRINFHPFQIAVYLTLFVTSFQ